LSPSAASVMPRTATPRVSGFGTRRDHRSTIAPAPPLAPIDVTTTASDVLNNGHPQPVVDDIAERADRHHRGDGDQYDEQSVLEKILAAVLAKDSTDGYEHTVHVISSLQSPVTSHQPHRRPATGDWRSGHYAGSGIAATIA